MRKTPLALIAATLLLGACASNETASQVGDPGNPAELRTLLRMVHQAESAGRDVNAAALYRLAHEQHPFDSAPLTSWGFLANRIGSYEQAADIFRSALSVDADDRDARRGLANALVNLDQPDDALGLYQELLTAFPDDHRAWNGVGVALDMLGRHGDAQVAYREGLNAAPDNLTLANNLGLSLALANQLDDAIEVLSDASGEDADIATVRWNLTLAYDHVSKAAPLATIARRDPPAGATSRNVNYYQAAHSAQLPNASE